MNASTSPSPLQVAEAPLAGDATSADDMLTLLSAAERGSAAKLKATDTWQNALWERWPREECWPSKLDVYEAAAYLRVSPDTIRRAMIVARDGKARLAHQRVGSVYRIRKTDLDAFGVIPGRSG